MYEDDCCWPEWVEEIYDNDYEEFKFLSPQSEDEDWEFVEE